MIKAVIFDMDGLLIDSEPMWRKSEMKIFREQDISLSEDDCRGTTGMRVDEVVRHWSAIYPEANLNIEKMAKDILDEVCHLVETTGEALPGVTETVNFFKNLGLPLAIASASGYDLIDKVITRINLKDAFVVIQSAEFMKYGKPHPEVFLETALRLGVKPEECLVFEDSVYGVLAGKAAKMKVVAVPDQYNSALNGYCIADIKINSLKEFSPDLWESLNN